MSATKSSRITRWSNSARTSYPHAGGMPGLTGCGSDAVMTNLSRIARVSWGHASWGGVDHGFQGAAVCLADREGAFGVSESETVGDHVGDVDRAAPDQLDGPRISVGVAERAGHGELSSLYEGDIQPHGVGAHPHQGDPARRGERSHPAGESGGRAGAFQEHVKLLLERRPSLRGPQAEVTCAGEPEVADVGDHRG